jgi:uncharacterized protein (TIGR00725 family)
VAVVGPGDGGATADQLESAEQIGRLLAEAGAVVVCGGLGGVMEAVCRGARSAGGLTVGILPGRDRRDANRFVEVAVPTGLGEARNALVVRAADAVVAVGGAYGTLSEIAFALKAGTPVVGLGTWELARGGERDDGVIQVDSAEQAARTALDLARK